MRVDTGRLRVVAHDISEAEDLSSYEVEDDAPELIPTRDDDLPSPGAYIEAQRVRRGMSIEQLAVVTKIPARSIELLEADRFDELPGQVFVKGFLRCCARALGVSQPAVMDLLYERERALLQARRKERVDPEDRAPRPGSKPSRAAKPAAKAKPRPSTAGKASKPSPAGKASKPSKPSKQSQPRAAKSGPVEAPVGLPPKLNKGTRPSVTAPSPVERLRELVPSAHALLWIVVAIFVAFLVLAAFNLAGSPVGAPGT